MGSRLRSLRILLLITAAAVIPAIFAQSWRAAREELAQSILSVDALDLNFGEAWVQRELIAELPIRNTSTKPIEIRGFDTSCACTRIEPTSITIAAGTTESIRLTLDVRPRPVEAQAAESSEFAVTIMPHGPQVPRGSVHWTVHGQVRRVISIDPPRLSLSYAPDALVSGTVVVKSAKPLSQLQYVGRTTAPASVEVRSVGESSQDFEVTVVPEPTLPLGIHRFDLHLQPMDSSGIEHALIPLPITLNVLPDLAVRPETVTFGVVAVGSARSEVVTVESRTGRRIGLTSIDIPPDAGVAVEVIPQTEADSTLTMKLHLQATQTGAQRIGGGNCRRRKRRN